MKRVLLIAALALGVSLMTSGKAAAASYECIGGVIATGVLGDNPFVSMGAGHRRIFPGLFAETGMMSMAFGSMEVLGRSMEDSMAFGMSPFSVSMGLKIELHPSFKSSSLLQKEFAALDRRTAVDLGSQVASGPSRAWTPLSVREMTALTAGPSLAGMTGR